MTISNQPEPATLVQLQQWMLASITNPQGLTAGLQHATIAHGRDASSMLAKGKVADVQAGLAVYANGYWLRLLACLQSDYPALRLHLGEDLFNFFCRSYLASFPPASYSLHDLGSHFTRFLRHTQRSAAREGHSLRFPLELALIEHARNCAQRAPGLEQTDYTAPDPMAVLLGAKTVISLPATTRLLLTAHPLAAFQPWLAAATVSGSDRPQHPLVSATSCIAISRHRYHVSWHALEDWQFYALSAARRQARTLSHCAQAAARRCHMPVAEIHAKLSLWLPVASAAGLLMTAQNTTTEQG